MPASTPARARLEALPDDALVVGQEHTDHWGPYLDAEPVRCRLGGHPAADQRRPLPHPAQAARTVLGPGRLGGDGWGLVVRKARLG